MRKTKAIYAALAAIMFILGMPHAVSAEGETTPPKESTPSQSQALFSIDNVNCYEGMDKPYNQGYMPQVQNGYATIILPLVSNAALEGNVMNVTPDLGGTAAAPFVIKNYELTVPLLDNSINSGVQTVSSYRIVLSLELAKGRMNGVYPVTIGIQGKTAGGEPLQQSFTTYVTITDGADPNATPAVEKPQPQPKIIISKHTLNPDPVVAGEEFTADITLQNTSMKQGVQNIKVTADCESTDFTLLNDTNTFFFDKLAKGGSLDVQIKYKVDLDAPPQPQKIMLSIEYEDSKASPCTAAGDIVVQVQQPVRVEMELNELPQQANAGDTLPVALHVMNLGRSGLFNVRFSLEGAGLFPSETAFIGNMEPGTDMTGQTDVFIGTKNMANDSESAERYGETVGTITLTYEDAAGQAYTDTTEFPLTINPPVIAPASAQPAEAPRKAGQWWVSVVIGAVIVSALVIWLVWQSRRKGKVDEIS